MNKKNRIILYYNLIFLLVILIGISSFFCAYFYNQIDTTIRTDEVSVVENSEVSYGVKELGNSTYTLNKSDFDIANIDSINTYFAYSLTFNDEVNGNYSYYITGYKVNNNEKTEIYKSDIVKYEITGSVINISSTFDINDIQSIIEDASNIEYIINIDYSVINEKTGRNISDKVKLNINIPNSEHTTIEVSDKVENSKKVYTSSKFSDNSLYVAILLEFMGAIILFIFIIVLILKAINRENDEYIITLERILKKYHKQIVVLKKVPDLSNMDVLFVDDFKDIADAAYNLDQVINYVQVIKSKASVFIVINNNIAYCYKLTR